jgi:hypothetical protein
VRKHYDEIRRLNGEVLVIAFTRPDQVANFLAKYPLPFPVVADPKREAYRTFGLGRTSWRTIFTGRIIWHYLKLMLRGWLPKKPGEGEDVLQLGGDFVIDSGRRLVYSYPSKDPTDRPPPAALVEAVRTTAAR